MDGTVYSISKSAKALPSFKQLKNYQTTITRLEVLGKKYCFWGGAGELWGGRQEVMLKKIILKHSKMVVQ